jgi:hypothetical protein
MSDRLVSEIERGLDADRRALAQSLAALRDRLRPEALLAEGKEVVLGQAAPLLAGIDGAVRAQPVMAAVAGVAAVALVLGRARAGQDAGAADPSSALAGTRYDALTRWEDEGGPPLDEPVDPEVDWLIEARGLRQSARHLLADIDKAVRRGLVPAAEAARHRTEVIAALGRDTRDALARGLEGLSGQVREQAILARERLYTARIVMAEPGRQAVESRPLASGALAAVAGAVVASVFPQTEVEDRLLGEARDKLVDDTKAALRREALQASDLAATLTAALKSDLRRGTSFLAGNGSSDAGLGHS